MKLIAFVEKTVSPVKVKVVLNFYKIPPALKTFNIDFEDGEIKIIKIIDLGDANFFDSLYFPSDEHGFLESPYFLEISRAIDALIDDVINKMSAQERYKFYDEILKDINQENRHTEQGVEPSSRWPTCYVEKDWRDLRKLNRDSRNYATPHLHILDSRQEKYREFCCASYKFVINEERIRGLFYCVGEISGLRDCNEIKFISKVVKDYLKVIPISSREVVVDFMRFAPLPGDIVAASNFVEIIAEGNNFNFSDYIWVDFLNYVVECRVFCVRALGGCDEVVIGILRKYLKIIPVSSHKDVSDLVGVAPPVGDVGVAYKFIKILSESNDFNFSDPIWVDFLGYVDNYRLSCISVLKKTERQDEYEVILETSLNAFVWSGGVDQFRAILVERMKSGEVGSLKNTIHSFVLDGVCKSFLTHSSVGIVNDLIKNFSSSHLYRSMSAENQLRIFNVYSAINCQKIFLNEESDENRLAVDYANERMMEIMRSVKWDAEKSIKKSFAILKKAEYRVAAALINKIVKDLDSYFAKPVVAEVYSALLLPNNPDRDWVTLCGSLPSIQSNFAIREGLARQFISIGDLEKAKSHIDAVVSFEPNSKTSIEIKALLAREEAIKSLVEDGVNVESIDKMAGVDFEKILIRKLQKIGFKVTETPGSGDYGADIILDDEDETRFIIQCKRFSSKVNLKAVQEVVAAMKHYSADYAIVATNNEFLKSAVELAKSNDVELWAGTKIMQVLSGDISETILATANLPK